ncbi:MAG: RsmE family RNA methyltransferase [Desulfomonilaceae bacterium]
MKSKLSARRIFIAQAQIHGSSVIFTSENVRNLTKVLRLKPGDQIVALDGARRYNLILEKNPHSELVGKILSCDLETTPFPLTLGLAFGCVRPGPTEEIIRHCTELGVSHFFPLLLEYSNRRPANARPRWLNIAASACAQSNRPVMPQIDEPLEIDLFLERLLPGSTLVYLSPEGDSPPLFQVLQAKLGDRITLLIGAEGGLTSREEALVINAGFVAASLGAATLRTETAAIVSVGISMNWGLILKKSGV